MSDIEELQQRITGALDRIARGLDGMSRGGSDDVEALREALEEEKLANAQLEERLKTVNAKHAAELDEARSAGGDQATQVERLDAELQALRRANQQLRENNQALREANAAGVGEPHLINKAMLAELEGLRATRAADAAEADAILERLDALIGDGSGDGDSKQAEEA